MPRQQLGSPSFPSRHTPFPGRFRVCPVEWKWLLDPGYQARSSKATHYADNHLRWKWLLDPGYQARSRKATHCQQTPATDNRRQIMVANNSGFLCTPVPPSPLGLNPHLLRRPCARAGETLPAQCSRKILHMSDLPCTYPECLRLHHARCSNEIQPQRTWGG